MHSAACKNDINLLALIKVCNFFTLTSSQRPYRITVYSLNKYHEATAPYRSYHHRMLPACHDHDRVMGRRKKQNPRAVYKSVRIYSTMGRWHLDLCHFSKQQHVPG